MEAVLVLLFIAAIFVSLTSLSEEGKLPYGWNKADTWKNKYSEYSRHLYVYSNGDLKPKFFGSTTFLVWTTDAYHFFQFMHLSLIQASISLLLFKGWYMLIGFIFIKLAMGFIMQLTRTFFTKRL